MKIVSKIYSKTVLAAIVAFGSLLTSCTDYLTIIPPDKVVEENFWQTKDQVNGMLATSYLKLLSADAVSKAIIWGELRSENMTVSTREDVDIKNIVEADIDDENRFCRWGIFYEAINYANLILECADRVVERDPDFSEGDLEVVKGEMYAMRALCHFYLVRTFRDIPLAMKSARNDAEIPEYVQVHPMEALNTIMADLDLAEKMVMKSGAFSSDQHNFGRITTNAVLAMKADVNLWRAAFAKYYEDNAELVQPGDDQMYYDACIENCRKVIFNMDSALKKKNENRPVEVFAYNLIQNKQKSNDNQSSAYDEIFGGKNSSESIFELQVQGDNVTNGRFNGVCNVYGTGSAVGWVQVPTTFAETNFEEDDLRRYSYVSAPPKSSDADKSIKVLKYVAKGSPGKNFRKSDDWDANWIIYRRTDVLLMMAEALVTRESAAETDFREAFNIVKAINTRSRRDSTDITNPLYERNYMTQEKSIELVRKERLLELSYEGKRWYDLVRLALREKSTKNIVYVAEKLENSAVVKIKMDKIDGLFMPIHIDELRYNKNLKQNPAYESKSETTEKN